MNAELTYKNYDDKSIIVFGDKTKYQKQINLMGGRWNSKHDGWVVPNINKNKVDNLIEGHPQKIYHREEIRSDDESSDTEDEKKSDTISGSEVINKPLSKVSVESELLKRHRYEEEKRKEDEENRLREIRKREDGKRKYTKHDPKLYERSFKDEDDYEENPYEYYRSFNKKPVDFRKINNISESESDDTSEDLESSSSDDSESSSDGFPSPRTPRKRDSYKYDREKEKYSYSELYGKVQDLQRRMSEMEMNHHKRK